jgi:hypothetical protein
MIKSITQHSYFEKKPNKHMGRLQNGQSIGWVHPKYTHACPLAWDNKIKMTCFYIILHDHVTSYKCNCFTLTLFYKTQNKFTLFYTYYVLCSTFTIIQI